MKLQRLLLLAALFTITHTYAQNGNFANAANAFINSLSAEQKAKVMYDFASDEKYNWHFIPINDRKGITLNNLDKAQQQKAFALLKLYLSDTAFMQAQQIMQLENVLHEIENRKPEDKYRDPGNYAFIFFGKPSAKDAWGWRFEGHHISFTFSTINNKIVSATPGFLGSNPAIVLSGQEKGKQVLKTETQLGFDFIQSLNKEQLSKAVMQGQVPGEIVTSNSRKAMIENPQGILYSDLNTEQQKLFMRLLSVYIQRYTHHFAQDLMHEIEQAGLDKLQFAWAGDIKEQLGSPYYYRIQGPTLLIELDNTQNNANHVHTVVRDLLHDFGDDVLLEHYKEDHKKN